MKTQTQLFLNISTTEISKLTQEVKETIASGYSNAKSFSAAELWNIQRQRKAIRTRRGFA